MLTDQQRDIVFWIIMGLFVVITIFTIWGVFIGFPELDADHKDKLFYVFIVEIGVLVLAIAKKSFTATRQLKLWISFNEKADMKKLKNKIVKYSTINDHGTSKKEAECSVLYDQVVGGYYISPSIPGDANSIYVYLELDEEFFGGSYSFTSHRIMLEQED